MACKNIFLVEDDVSIQESLRLALELEGYKLYVANNGQEALDLWPQMEDSCLIILDLMMPVMDGFEFLAERKKVAKLAAVPVVVVSAFPDKAKEVGASAYIKKPINLNLLFEQVKRFC